MTAVAPQRADPTDVRAALPAAVEATLLVGDPPRTSRLALWHPEETVAGADAEVVLAVPAGSVVRRRTVPVRTVAIADLLDKLVSLPADAPLGASVHAWATAARLAVELVSRGRLTPGMTAGGAETWRLGPLDPDDVRRRHQLAEALPPAAHCVALDGSPLQVVTSDAAVRAFGDAVADLLPRTSAAEAVIGHPAFAGGAAQIVEPFGDWFSMLSGTGSRTTVSLRLLPPDLDDAFTAELVLQSPEDPSLVIGAGDLWAAPDAVLARFADAEEVLLLTLRRAARVWPPLERLLDEARPTSLVLDDVELDDLLGTVVDQLGAAGLSVHWPSELLAPVELRPTISTPSPEQLTGAGFSLDALLEWRATLDGEALSEAELEQLAAAKRGVVRLRGRWVRADPERLARLRERRSVGAGAALGVALGGTFTVDGEVIDAEVTGPLADLGDRLSGIDQARERREPPGLEAELRPYQRRGLAWLNEMATLGLGGTLADDMGLGKTIQVLALHLDRHASADTDPEQRAGPLLVVCPASLIANWEHEAARFAPAIPVRRYHGSDRDLDALDHDEIVLTTYGVVRRDADELATVDWGLMVADEAQAVKNPHSRGARALRKIGAGARFALTGTPVENQLSELWAICDWTTPGLLGPLESFRRDVAIPVERHRDPDVSAWLSTLVRPFLLRRRKVDPGIAPELPPKTETDQFVGLSAEQTTLYRATVDQALADIREAEGIQRRGLVLKLITALKQICNHPAQYLGQPAPLTGRSGKFDAAAELLDIVASEGDSALVFTQYVVMGKLLQRHLAEAGLRVGFLHGSLGLGARQELVESFQSGELDVLVLSLKAGGTGLNLTRATHVVHYDRWWNPAVEDQASDRAWRIGQDRPVQVHRLMCEGTVEDRIATLLESKRDLADRVVGAGEAWISELDDDELADLVSLSGSGG